MRGTRCVCVRPASCLSLVSAWNDRCARSLTGEAPMEDDARVAPIGEQRRRRAASAPHAARQRRACPWAGATTHGIRSWSANARRPRAATAHRRPSSRNASRHRAAATQPGATRRKRSCSCRDIRVVRGPDARGLARPSACEPRRRGSCERTC